MTYEYSEDGLIEQATQDVLEELGWEVVTVRSAKKLLIFNNFFINL
jgi:type I restriction enzyme, R subunit